MILNIEIRLQKKINNKLGKIYNYKTPSFAMNQLLFNQKVAFII